MRIGFTGTRDGMTEQQKDTLRALLPVTDQSVCLHHGDCVGADAEAHDIAKAMGCRIITHPPIDEALRAFKAADECRKPKSYLARNKDIVYESDHLIAAPKNYGEQRSGGTWWTVRFARGRKKRVYIIRPDGRVERS